MKKENNFDTELQKVIEILKDRNVTEEGKEKIYDEFLSKYPYFNSSKLDKYFI